MIGLDWHIERAREKHTKEHSGFSIFMMHTGGVVSIHYESDERVVVSALGDAAGRLVFEEDGQRTCMPIYNGKQKYELNYERAKHLVFLANKDDVFDHTTIEEIKKRAFYYLTSISGGPEL